MQNTNSNTQDGKLIDRLVARRHAVVQWVAQGFAIDVRSLAVFRMAIASMVLFDLAERVPDLAAHYTDAGVLPRAARIVMESNGSSSAGSWAWSLHMASGTTAGQAALFLIAAWFAVSMLIGYRTRLACVACWLLVVSIHYRNPPLEDAGDTILRTILFWSMFLPLGATASVDRLLSPLAPPAPRQIISLSGAALLLQICLIYWTAAAEKHSPVWRSEHTAIYYTLSLDTFATGFGHRLLAYPQLLKWSTAAVYWFEWLGPAMALLPVKRGLPKLLAVLGFWSLHLGTACTLELGAFPWVAMAIWTVALPGALWERLAPLWRSPGTAKLVAGAKRAVLNLLPPGGAAGQRCPAEDASGASPRQSFSTRPYNDGGSAPAALVAALGRFAITVVLLFLVLYTILWNINQVTGMLERRLSPRWKMPAYVLGLKQGWRMFAPFPMTEDGWYEMRGRLADGGVVNLWQPGQPLPRIKPAFVAATYRNRRWRNYLINVRGRFAAFAPELAEWLARRWNEHYAGDSPQRRVTHVDIIFHLEQTLSPDRVSTLIVPEIVFEGDVGDNLLALPHADN